MYTTLEGENTVGKENGNTVDPDGKRITRITHNT